MSSTGMHIRKRQKTRAHLTSLFTSLFASCALFSSSLVSAEQVPAPASQHWQSVVEQAKGQSVYFHAWGGSQTINQYLRWASRELQSQYQVKLVHVKVSDIAETNARLLAEKTAGKNENGSVDLVWINGENFKSLKQNQLLFGPFVETLPNWQHVDQSLPVDKDFTEPTEGLEAPWGLAQLVFIYDTKALTNPPTSANELLAYAKAHPGRMTYPQPPEFHGSSFLKALLIELTDDPNRLQRPVDENDFDTVTAPLWHYLDALHPVAWQQGQRFPTSQPELLQLFDDGQVDLALTFNPNEIDSAKAQGKLADSAKAYAWEQGALSNIHFLAIPWNAAHKAGAQVAINFLLSPQAQSRKGDSQIWGDPAVIDANQLTGSAKQSQLFKSIDEPHPSWQTALEQAWLKRYGS